MQNRQYLKRVWRVPKDQGAAVYFAALLKKALRKHGWPAEVVAFPDLEFGAVKASYVGRASVPADYYEAFERAVRVLGHMHNLKLSVWESQTVYFDAQYCVRENHFREVKMIKQGKAGVPVKEVVLHCAALRRGQFDGFTPHQVFTEIDRWHRERGFSNGFGYHGFFMPDGSFHQGRPDSMIGAHCIEVNKTGSLGWLLIESAPVTRIGRFSDYFTTAQRDAVVKRFQRVRALHNIELLSGHNDYAKRLCPGFDVDTWYHGETNDMSRTRD